MFDDLFPKIPLHEAAAFFYSVKHAGWGDPPDLTGELEGAFNVPAPQVAGFLAQVITAKFKMVVAYYTYAETMRDVAQHGVGDVFHEHALHELSAAEYYLKRAAVLGGAVSLQEVEPPPASTDPVHIVQVMMRAEQEAIALQRQLKDMVGDENPMKVEVEEKLAKDQHHLDELWQMLPPELHEAAQGEMAAAGVPPPGAEAESSGPGNDKTQPPEGKAESGVQQPGNDEKEASTRLRLGLQMKLAGTLIPIDFTGSASKNNFLGAVNGLREATGRITGKVNPALRDVASHVDPAAMERSLGSGKAHALAGLGGAGLGALLGHSNAKAYRANAKKNPDSRIAQFAGEHPGIAGAGMGALGGAGGWALGGALNKMGAEKTTPTNDELKETGRQRAVTGLAAEAHREKGRHGERVGETLGRAGGALAGAAMGRKLIGGRLGTVAGLAAGMGVGGKAGKELGAEHDVHKNAAKMKLALRMKLAYGPPLDEYMAAHQAGEQAQQQNEAEFYRGKLQEMQATGQGTQQQVADLTMQLQQAQEQQAQVGATIQAANEEAMSARDDAMQHAQMTANMRLGYQKIREQILQLASQDPETLNSLPTAMPPGSGAGMAPGMADGMGVGQPGAVPGAVMPGEVPAGDGAEGAPGAVKPADGQPGASAANPTMAPSSVKMGGVMDHVGNAALHGLDLLSGSAQQGAEQALRFAHHPADVARAAYDATKAHTSTMAARGVVGAAGLAGIKHHLDKQKQASLMDHAGAIAGGALGAVAGAKNALGKAKELPDRTAALEGATQGHDGSFASALEVAKARAGVAESESAAAHPISTALKGGLKGGAMGAAGGAMAQRLGGNLGQLFQ